MQFNVDTDTRNSRIYVAPFKVDNKRPWLIWVDNLPGADRLARDLMMGKINCPRTRPENYELVETIKEKMGEVDIYRLKV